MFGAGRAAELKISLETFAPGRNFQLRILQMEISSLRGGQKRRGGTKKTSLEATAPRKEFAAAHSADGKFLPSEGRGSAEAELKKPASKLLRPGRNFQLRTLQLKISSLRGEQKRRGGTKNRRI